MFLTPEGRPASEGPVFSFAVSDNNSWTSLSIGDHSGALTGGGGGGELLGSALPVIFLAALHSDQPNCLVYLL